MSGKNDLPTKLLFLDIDGVLNSVQSSAYFYRTRHDRKCFMNSFEELCPISCNNLNEILEQCEEVRVVISSTWRKYHDLEEFELKMKDLVPSIVGRVIGCTPILKSSNCSVPRGHEIFKYLHQNGFIESKATFVIVDDDCDMEKVEENFVKVDAQTGLTWHNVVEILKRFGVRCK